MSLPRRGHLGELANPERFFWATGIEDTFITAPHVLTGRTLDEYALCGHYERWREDLRLMRDLGVTTVRYGVPWHRIQPTADSWDFSWADGPLEGLLELGIEPIVDLVHYGLPAWLSGAWLDSRLPQAMSTYAGRLAERFAGRIHWWTPLNEPRITAWYCGKLGWWPPGGRGWRSFVQVLLGIARAIIATCDAIHAVDPRNVCAHVDATDLYAAGAGVLQEEASWRQELVFLPLDLISGRVGPDHPLYAWLLGCGAREEELAELIRHQVALETIGINLYPLFSSKILSRGNDGMRVRMPYAGADIIPRLAHLYGSRYGVPLWIAETASLGKRRASWLADSARAVAEARAIGFPLCGYTWWPLFALVTWGYRQGNLPPERYQRQMGLYDCDDAFNRIPTSLVEQFRQLVSQGAPRIPEMTHVP